MTTEPCVLHIDGMNRVWVLTVAQASEVARLLEIDVESWPEKLIRVDGQMVRKCAWPTCGFQAGKKDCLKHMQAHLDTRTYPCEEKGCGKSFVRIDHLEAHMAQHQANLTNPKLPKPQLLERVDEFEEKCQRDEKLIREKICAWLQVGKELQLKSDWELKCDRLYQKCSNCKETKERTLRNFRTDKVDSKYEKSLLNPIPGSESSIRKLVAIVHRKRHEMKKLVLNT
jgi:hypothetical protein